MTHNQEIPWTVITLKSYKGTITSLHVQLHSSMNLTLHNQYQTLSSFNSDASDFGIGRYYLSTGLAWRFEIPPNSWLCATLYFLKFIACVIT
jgi:hypothetical protein